VFSKSDWCFHRAALLLPQHDVGLCVAPSCDESILKAQFIDFYYMFFIRGLEIQGFDCVTGTSNTSGVSAPANSPATFIMSVVAVMSVFLTYF
jgi:hypothetical protein